MSKFWVLAGGKVNLLNKVFRLREGDKTKKFFREGDKTTKFFREGDKTTKFFREGDPPSLFREHE